MWAIVWSWNLWTAKPEIERIVIIIDEIGAVPWMN